MFLGDYENCKTNLELDQERRKNEFEVSLGLKDSTRSVKIGQKAGTKSKFLKAKSKSPVKFKSVNIDDDESSNSIENSLTSHMRKQNVASSNFKSQKFSSLKRSRTSFTNFATPQTPTALKIQPNRAKARALAKSRPVSQKFKKSKLRRFQSSEDINSEFMNKPSKMAIKTILSTKILSQSITNFKDCFQQKLKKVRSLERSNSKLKGTNEMKALINGIKQGNHSQVESILKKYKKELSGYRDTVSILLTNSLEQQKPGPLSSSLQ